MAHKLKLSLLAALFVGALWLTLKDRDQENVMIRIPVNSSKLVFDPHLMHDSDSMLVNLQIHRGLLRYLPDGSVAPDLAESWSLSEDKTIYRFELRNSKFSNGKKITPEVVVQSLARLFWKSSSMAADMNYLKGTSQFMKSGKIEDLGVRAVSESAVEFELLHPTSLFIKHLAAVDCAVIDLQSFTDSYNPTAVTTGFSGPYNIKSQDTKITLNKWRTDLHDSQRPPATIELFNVAPKEIFEKALAGHLDAADNIVLNIEARSQLGKLNWQPSVAELTRERFVIMNPNTVSLEIRKYLFLTFETELFVKALGEPLYHPAFGLIPTGIQGGLSKIDLKTVKDSLGETALPQGTVELMYSNEFPQNIPIVNELKKMWDRPQFTIKLVGVTTAEAVDTMVSGKGQIVFGAKGIDYPDGIAVLNYFKSGFEPNLFHSVKSDIDDELNKLNSELSAEERLSKYRNLQIRILKNLTVVPLLFGSGHAGLWSPRLSSVPAHPMGLHTLPFEMLEVAQ